MSTPPISNNNGHRYLSIALSEPNESLENLSSSLKTLYNLTIQAQENPSILQNVTTSEQCQSLWGRAVQIHIKLPFNIQEKLDELVIPHTTLIHHEAIGFSAFLQSGFSTFLQNMNCPLEELNLRLDFLNQSVQELAEKELEISDPSSVKAKNLKYELSDQLTYLCRLLEKARDATQPSLQKMTLSTVMELYESLPSDTKEKLNRIAVVSTLPVYKMSFGFITLLKTLNDPSIQDRECRLDLLCQCMYQMITSINEDVLLDINIERKSEEPSSTTKRSAPTKKKTLVTKRRKQSHQNSADVQQQPFLMYLHLPNTPLLQSVQGHPRLAQKSSPNLQPLPTPYPAYQPITHPQQQPAPAQRPPLILPPFPKQFPSTATTTTTTTTTPPPQTQPDPYTDPYFYSSESLVFDPSFSPYNPDLEEYLNTPLDPDDYFPPSSTTPEHKDPSK